MMTSKRIRIAAAITLFVIISGLLFEKNRNTNITAPTETSSGLSAEQENDRDEGLRIIKSYVTAYNSYRLGDVSNLTTLYPIMCDSLVSQEKARAETISQKYADFKEYVTVESEIDGATVKSYSAEKISAEVAITKNTLDGAFLPDPSGIPGSFMTVDRNGQAFTGAKADMISSSIMEIYAITAIKQSSQWMICESNKIN